MTVVAIGKNSFLGETAAQHPQAASWRFLSHKEALDPKFFEGASCVVNFALNSKIKKGILTPETDFDSQVAKLIKGKNIHYAMISSRTVYGPSKHDGVLRETDTPAPVTGYGKAKLQIENSLKEILGEENLTILRLSSIFGFEIDERRQSFFSMALCKLLENGTIEYNMDPRVRRDFLSVHRCADALVTICNQIKPGTYNVGCGFGQQTQDVADWLIEGFGSGKLVITDSGFNDQFWLDMEKTRKTFNIKPVTKDDLKEDCVSLGKALRVFASEGKQSWASRI